MIYFWVFMSVVFFLFIYIYNILGVFWIKGFYVGLVRENSYIMGVVIILVEDVMLGWFVIFFNLVGTVISFSISRVLYLFLWVWGVGRLNVRCVF